MNARKKITVERWRNLPDIELSGNEVMIFKEKYLDGPITDQSVPDSDRWKKIDLMESSHEGLQSYW